MRSVCMTRRYKAEKNRGLKSGWKTALKPCVSSGVEDSSKWVADGGSQASRCCRGDIK